MNFKDYLRQLSRGEVGDSRKKINSIASRVIPVASIFGQGRAAGSLYNAANTVLDKIDASNPVQGLSTTASGGGVATVSPEQQLRQQRIGSIQSKYNTLQGVFDSLYGNIDNVAREKANAITSDYDRQATDLQKGYEKAVGQTDMIYGARGLADSSYRGGAQAQNTEDFQRSNDEIGRNKTSALASIGQFLGSAKASLQPKRDAYSKAVGELGNYDDGTLASLDSGLDSAIGDARANAENYLTQNDAMARLSQVSPVQSQGTSQLASRLQALVTSSAPIWAKREIAKGLVKANNLTDEGAQSYWGNYFDQLLRDNGAI